MNHGTPYLSVHHQLLEFTQTHVHRVSDAIQPSHPLSSPSPPAPNTSQHQGLFQWVNSSHEVAKVLEFQLQHQSFQWTPRADLLQDGLVGSPCSPRDSQEASPTTVQKHRFFGAQLSSQSNSYIEPLKGMQPPWHLDFRPLSTGSSKKQETSRKTSISALLTMPKPSTVWITINCGKFWKRWRKEIWNQQTGSK